MKNKIKTNLKGKKIQLARPKRATIQDLELGNLFFGHSRGTYPVSRELEDMFQDWLDSHGFDNYGYPEFQDTRTFSNEIFTIRPYYWGDDETEMNLPNFEYHPSGFTMDWYKYPLRDAYSNQPMDEKRMKKILEECAKSLSKLN